MRNLRSQPRIHYHHFHVNTLPQWYSGTSDEVREFFLAWRQKLRNSDNEIKLRIQRIKEAGDLAAAGNSFNTFCIYKLRRSNIY